MQLRQATNFRDYPIPSRVIVHRQFEAVFFVRLFVEAKPVAMPLLKVDFKNDRL